MTEQPTDGAIKAAQCCMTAMVCEEPSVTRAELAAIIDREAVAPAVRELAETLEAIKELLDSEENLLAWKAANETHARYRHLLEAE